MQWEEGDAGEERRTIDSSRRKRSSKAEGEGASLKNVTHKKESGPGLAGLVRHAVEVEVAETVMLNVGLAVFSACTKRS